MMRGIEAIRICPMQVMDFISPKNGLSLKSRLFAQPQRCVDRRR